MTRVLVAADSPVVRAGLAALVAAQPALTVVGSVRARELLTGRGMPGDCDVVVLELEAGDDPRALRTLVAPGQPALVLLGDDAPWTWAGEALRAGARAALPRTASAEEIVATVQAAGLGLVVLHGEVADALIAGPRPARVGDGGAPALTPREREVLNMIAEGLGNKTIAPRLGISEHTVKFHIASLFSKLHVSSRAEAVAVGGRLGLILL